MADRALAAEPIKVGGAPDMVNYMQESNGHGDNDGDVSDELTIDGLKISTSELTKDTDAVPIK